MLLVMSMYFFISELQGRTIIMRGGVLAPWQVVGCGLLFLVGSIVLFVTGFKDFYSGLKLSETLENKESRNKKKQNQGMDLTR